MHKKITSDLLTGAGAVLFVLGVLFLNIFLIIFGIVAMIISIFLPYTG